MIWRNNFKRLVEMVSSNIELHGAIWMTIDGANLGGLERVTLLEKIASCGSITQAAKAIKMSYKAAWDAINTMNNIAGEPLVERVAGGKGGGGTLLTSRGKQLVKNFRIIEREHNRFIEALDQQSGNITNDYLLIKRIGMKTSARNQFLGKVSKITPGAVNDEIELEVAGDHKIIAIITHESSKDLALAVGVEAFALIKSSSIIIVVNDESTRFSARNTLTGTVVRIQPGAVNTEIVLDLNNGGSVAAIITNTSINTLELAEGKTATAIFKASDVIIGLPA